MSRHGSHAAPVGGHIVLGRIIGQRRPDQPARGTLGFVPVPRERIPELAMQRRDGRPHNVHTTWAPGSGT